MRGGRGKRAGRGGFYDRILTAVWGGGTSECLRRRFPDKPLLLAAVSPMNATFEEDAGQEERCTRTTDGRRQNELVE